MENLYRNVSLFVDELTGDEYIFSEESLSDEGALHKFIENHSPVKGIIKQKVIKYGQQETFNSVEEMNKKIVDLITENPKIEFIFINNPKNVYDINKYKTDKFSIGWM